MPIVMSCQQAAFWKRYCHPIHSSFAVKNVRFLRQIQLWVSGLAGVGRLDMQLSQLLQTHTLAALLQ